MKEYRVEVAAFVFISIDSLHIQQQANEHSKAIICGKISGNHEEEYLSKTSKEFWTRIYAVDGERREQVIFNGLVTDSSVAKRENEIFLQLC